MATPKIVHGARALFSVDGKVVGVFTNVRYSVAYDTQAAFILGRASAAEIDYTGMEPVSVSASGWRVIDNGPHVSARLPPLETLLTADYIQLSIIDRITQKTIAQINDCRATNFSTSISPKQLTEYSVDFVGLLADDETVTNHEATDAANLP
jgi:hypothetical protein